MPRYTTDRARPGLVALYDVRPGNGAGQFLQPRSPHGAENTVLDHYNSCGDHADLTLRWRRRPQTAAQLLQLGLSLPPEILLLLSTEQFNPQAENTATMQSYAPFIYFWRWHGLFSLVAFYIWPGNKRQQKGHPACKNNWCWFVCHFVTEWHFHRNFARLIAPVVTTTTIALSSNKIQNKYILVSTNSGPPGNGR